MDVADVKSVALVTSVDLRGVGGVEAFAEKEGLLAVGAAVQAVPVAVATEATADAGSKRRKLKSWPAMV
jgi:hypothetical protein